MKALYAINAAAINITGLNLSVFGGVLYVVRQLILEQEP
jgi:hypothetical protein